MDGDSVGVESVQDVLDADPGHGVTVIITLLHALHCRGHAGDSINVSPPDQRQTLNKCFVVVLGEWQV